MTRATLLIVEDDGILAANLEAIIRDLGYGVLGPVPSGEAALALLQEQPADLVLMDIELAGILNGIETATIINRDTNTPIVFLTGYSQDPLLEQAKNATPYGYLIKPVPERELAATVAMSLHRHELDRQLQESRAAQARSEAKYRHLFEDSPLGIFRTTVDGRLLLINEKLSRMLGYASPEEALHHCTDLGQQLYADPGRRLKFFDLLRTRGKVRDFTFRGRKKNGECLWISLNARLTANDSVTLEDGSVIEGFAQDITARTKAETALQESLERHRHYLQSTPYGVFAVDRHGRYLQVNPAACRITGYSEGELLTMSIPDLLFPEDRKAGQHHFQTVLREGRAQDELAFRTKTSERRWWAITAVKADDGRYLEFCNDITERRRAEIGLRESETNFRAIFASMTDMLLVAEPEGRILAANEMLCQTLGYNEVELAAMRVPDLHPADRAGEAESILAAILRGEHKDYRLPLRTKTGDLVPAVSRIWRGNWNRRSCLFGISRDLSAEQEAEQRFEQMFRHNPALMALSDSEDQTFLDVNDVWLATTGYSRDEVLGRTSLELGLFASPEQFIQATEQLQNEGRITNIELQIRCKNGTLRYGLFSGETIRSKGHQALLTVMIDITGRKQAEEALERRMIALVQPLDSPEGIAIEELFNLEDLQRIQDEFAAATGIASLITQPDGTPLTRPSNFCRLCAEVIRTSERGRANCCRSDALVGQACIAGPIIQPCLSGGLWDAGAAIIVGGRHIASWLIGQVRDETQTEAQMRAYAREIGVDEKTMIQAFREVPSMSRERFEKIAQALFTLANQLSTAAYQNMQQARFITERTQVELALQREVEERRILLDNIQTQVWYLTDERTYGAVNRAHANFTGLKIGQMAFRPMAEIFPPDVAANAHQTNIVVFASGKPLHTEEWIPHASGERRLLSILKSPVKDRDGTVNYVVCSAEDVTDRKHAEMLRRESEERYRELVENANSIILRMDREGRLLFFNEYAQRFFGYRAEEVLGRNMVGTIVPETDSRNRDLHAFIADIGRNPELHTTSENENMRRDGTRVWISWTNKPLYNETGEVAEILCVGNDITERRRAEEEKRQLQTQLLHAQKLESIGTLAGGIAHDFNNILAAVIGYADMAKEEVEAGTSLARDLDQVLKAGHRAKDLVKQILAFSRQGEDQPVSFYPAAVVKEAIKLLRPILPATIAISKHLDEKAGPVRIDPTQMHQMLMNLCTNAFHAMEKQGGELDICLRRVELDAVDVAARPSARPGAYIELAIGDTGPGIPPDLIDRIFDPFFTTKELGKGTGMGLSIVHGIAKSGEGFVTVDSVPGQGTTFHVFLPIVAEDQPDVVSSEELLPQGREHILFIDDEEMLISMAKDMLERLGYLVTVRSNSFEALTTFQNQPDRFDLVITDLTMPGMTGLDLSRRLLQIWPELPIILCTGFSTLVSEEKARAMGIRALAYKPLTKKDMAFLIRKILNPD